MSDPFRSRVGIVLNSAPPPPARFEPLEFAAPVGTRVRLITILVVAIVAGAVVVNLVLRSVARLPPETFWPMTLAPLVGLAVVFPIAFFQRVLGYRVTADTLEVLRHGRVNRFALAGLKSVVVDQTAMKWSVKVFGNDGLGAITGRFYNRGLGRYQALATDRDRAVVLRWPDRCLVVSPDQPAEFALAIRARAHLETE